MVRYKNIGGVRVPFTPEEEAARDAEEAQYLAEQLAATSDPTNFPLSRWQFHAMIDMLGKRSAIDVAIVSMSDTNAQAVATAKLTHSSRFHRDDPLVVDLSAAVGMTPTELDAAWMTAKDLV